MLGRRTIVEIQYGHKIKMENITKSIEKYLISFEYTDNNGKSDEIRLRLHDVDGKWIDPWIPEKGDRITAKIITINRDRENDTRSLNCGAFYVSDVTFSGPPATVEIIATSLKTTNSEAKTKKTRTYSSISLLKLCGNIADANELQVEFSGNDVQYDKLQQSKESDLAFITRINNRAGNKVKITDDRLVVYNAEKQEMKKRAFTITNGHSLVKSYNFSTSTVDTNYKTVEVNYYNTKTKKNVSYKYEVPDVTDGTTYKHNERVSSLAEAKRVAQNIARLKNEKTTTVKFTLYGNTDVFQGLCAKISGYGKFDGTYYIDTAKHRVGGGYTTDIEMRKVLRY